MSTDPPSTICGLPFSYRAFGASIASAFPLRFTEQDDPAPEITIRTGSIPDAIKPATRRFLIQHEQDVTIRVSPALHFRVTDGASVIVDRSADCAEADIDIALTSVAMGVVGLQRGRLPLHASAVEIAGGCVAFVGRSGTGKSTLAAALTDCGCRLVADDTLMVGFDREDRAIAWRGPPESKLSGAALEALGRSSRGLARVRDGADKFYLRRPDAAGADPLPLSHICFIGADDGAPPPRGLTALHALRSQCHGATGAARPLYGHRQIAALARLAQQVPIIMLRVEHGLDRLPAEAVRIATCFAKMMRG